MGDESDDVQPPAQLYMVRLAHVPGPEQHVGPFRTIDDAEKWVQEQRHDTHVAFQGFLELTMPEDFMGYDVFMRTMLMRLADITHTYAQEALGGGQPPSKRKEDLN